MGERLTWQQFVEFVVYSPPTSAVYTILNEGWEATTHKVSDLIEWVKMLLCANAEDPQKAYNSLERDKRPGQTPANTEPPMTIGDYMNLSGMEG